MTINEDLKAFTALCRTEIRAIEHALQHEEDVPYVELDFNIEAIIKAANETRKKIQKYLDDENDKRADLISSS